MTARTYSTRRNAIVKGIVDMLITIDGSGDFISNLSGNVFGKLKFYDEVSDFPAVCVTAGNETREYQTGGYRDRFLGIRIMVFVKQENPLDVCESILEDIESLLEGSNKLTYVDKSGSTQTAHDILILSLSTDEGTLDPISIGEMNIRVHY
mgnify:CR=1 FL=1|tara:strand:+ start:38273 stop:38725 length:453 start_codon:yes stop_codon:yes gene_type:complete